MFPTDQKWGEEAKSTSVDHKDLQFMPYLSQLEAIKAQMKGHRIPI